MLLLTWFLLLRLRPTTGAELLVDHRDTSTIATRGSVPARTTGSASSTHDAARFVLSPASRWVQQQTGRHIHLVVILPTVLTKFWLLLVMVFPAAFAGSCLLFVGELITTENAMLVAFLMGGYVVAVVARHVTEWAGPVGVTILSTTIAKIWAETGVAS